MFKRVETVVPETTEVIPETVEESFACDHCEYVSESTGVAHKHFAREHAIKGQKRVCDEVFVLFEKQEDFDVYQEYAPERFAEFRDKGDWDGSGWYRVRTFSRPCPRHCCTDYVETLESFETWKRDLLEEIEEKKEQIQDTELALKGEDDAA